MAENDDDQQHATPRPDDNGNNSDSSEEEEDEGHDSMYFVHDVVEQGAIERLRELLPGRKEKTVKNDGEENESHTSMQVMAVETCLLEKDDMGCLPVHVAVIYQRMDCALHLLQYSQALTTAMVRMKCADLSTPFVHLILRVGGINAAFATDLITQIYGPKSVVATGDSDDLRAVLFEILNAKDDEGNSVFHLCAMFNLRDAMETLLQFFSKILLQQQPETASSSSSSSMAEIAALPQVKTLLEKGNRLGLRALHMALKFGSMDVARLLVDALSVDVNSLTSLKQTPLHIAATYGALDGVSLLLKGKNAQPSAADPSRLDASGSTALEIAKRSHFDSIARLLSSGKPANGSKKATKNNNSSHTTRFFFHQDSLHHLPMAYHRRGGNEPPPENPERIDTLVDPLVGILRSSEFQKNHISWDHEIEQADMADILRVHEYHYVRKIRQSCESLAPPPGVEEKKKSDDGEDDDKEETGKTFVLDPDTALSLRSYEAASRAAGAVCRAVDQVVRGDCTNAFCIVRPPGHHAGPTGKVTCCNDPEGSHGFCVFNNVAIGAAYARSHFKQQGIHKIAILDFDVHHGNGTEEIIRQLVPTTTEFKYATPYGEGKQIVHQYKPWRNEGDPQNVFFASVHGYGHKDPQGDFSSEMQEAWFYPGSGESTTTTSNSEETGQSQSQSQSQDEPVQPLILNVGMGFYPQGASVSRLKWRSAFRDDVLPKLMAFQPDLIFLSSGFDAHKKEHVNWGYIALLEQDYEWLVSHVKQVAQSCCQGRLISVLEGGYNFHGRMVSPFARSVAAHARALANPSKEAWHEELIAKEASHEKAILDNYLAPPVAMESSSAISVKSKKRSLAAKEEEEAGTAAQDTEEGKEGGDDDEQAAEVAAPATVTTGRSKRARKQVDYVALAAELAKQDKQAAK